MDLQLDLFNQETFTREQTRDFLLARGYEINTNNGVWKYTKKFGCIEFCLYLYEKGMEDYHVEPCINEWCMGIFGGIDISYFLDNSLHIYIEQVKKELEEIKPYMPLFYLDKKRK